MFKDNPILSRLMAIALLGSVVAALWVGVVVPVLDQQNFQRAEIDRAQQQIKRFEQRRDSIAALRKQLLDLQNDRTHRGAYLIAKNPTLAAVKMQSRIKALAEAAGAQLLSTQLLSRKGKNSEGERVTVRARMTGSIESVRHVFHALESGKPYIFLGDVTISTKRTRRRNKRNAKPDQATNPLSVRFEAYGFLKQMDKS